MPSSWFGYRRRKPTCRKPFRWSTMRGGCRFEPGHKGECKPASRRQKRHVDWA